VLEREGALGTTATVVEKARERSSRWEIDSDGWEMLVRGLRRIYQRGRKAFGRATQEPTEERLHDWRKRSKDLWHVLQVLEPIQPEWLTDLAERAHQLADHLGDDHDLAVLRNLLVDQTARIGGPRQLNKLLPLIDRRRAELIEAAFTLGARVYGPRPKQFVASLKEHWCAWRATSRS
jgi:CHAD domain-containing protein